MQFILFGFFVENYQDFTQLLSAAHCIVGAATLGVFATAIKSTINMAAASNQRMRMLSVDSVLFIFLYLPYFTQC